MRVIPVGSKLRITTASGKILTKRAITGVTAGVDFPVVWACSEDEWRAAEGEGREPQGAPWPAEDVDIAGQEPSQGEGT